MPNVPAAPPIHCSACGAACSAFADQCWLCHASVRNETQVVTAQVVPRPPSYAPTEWFFAGLTGLVALLLLLVAVGATLVEPTLGLGFIVLVLPPVAVTLLRLRRKQQARGPVTWTERFVTFFLSLVFMFALVSVLAVVGVIAFFVYCVASVATQGGLGPMH